MDIVEKKSKIYSVENLRGLAAFVVFIFHATGTVPANNNIHIVSKYGYLGVPIFFVISGFVIPWSLHSTGYKIKNFFSFLLKRILRIMPPYLISVILILFLNFLSSRTKLYAGLPFHINFEQLLLHVVLLGNKFGFDWYQPVYTTLQFEFQFYILLGLVFFGLVYNNRLTFYLSIAALILGFFIIPINIFSVIDQFLIGIIFFKYKIGHLKLYEFWSLEIAIIVFSFFFNFDKNIYIAEVIALIGIVYWNSKNVITQFMGKISYSFYLIHIPVGGRVTNFFFRYVHSGPGIYLVILLTLAICLVAAWLFYKFVELPSIRLSRMVVKKF